MVRNEYQIASQPGYTVDYAKSSLIQLIRHGYGVHNENEQETLLTPVQSYEYRNADKVYFALNKNGSEVGSLSIGFRPNIGNDPFWQTLQSLLQQDIETNSLACNIYGIVVHPQVRREGIASHLLSRMIEDLNPQIIFGQTNVPEVVLLRTRVARQYDYRTFYGFCEVTPDGTYERENEGKPFVKAGLVAEEVETDESGVYGIGTNILPPHIPDTDNFPPQLQRAFGPVQKVQKAVGKEQTAVTALVSVKDKLLRRLYE